MQRLVEQPIDGMYQALIEARIPFEMVHDKMLRYPGIDKYKLLLLPNIAALSDAQCRPAARFCQSAEAAWWPATKPRSMTSKATNATISRSAICSAPAMWPTSTPRKQCRTPICEWRRRALPLLHGMEDAEFLMGGTWQLTTRPQTGAMHPPLTRIPAVANLPMEKTFWTLEKTDEPEVYMQEFGKGRVVYFSWDLDRLVWDVLSLDHVLLLQNAIQWAANEPAPLRSRGAGFFDVTAWRQKTPSPCTW